MEHLEAVEDAVQFALMKALETWTRSGLPDTPPAWLFRVAHNELMGELRRQSNHRRILERHPNAAKDSFEDPSESPIAEHRVDDLLRMLFVCADSSISVESQVALALKTLCGFGVREIALRLFTSEATVYKRLARARDRLRENPPRWGEITDEQYSSRTPAVRRVLYVFFTEGYLSLHAKFAIRRELCDEALRLATLLAEHPVGQQPETFALLALMHLHVARLTARQDASGGLLLLEEQDRTRWEQDRICTGLEWLAKSAQGEVFSRYHAEAAIAAEHCLAASFQETRWDRVASCYELLERDASPIHRLNRAIAVAEWQGPAEGLAIVDGFEPPTWLAGSYMWVAVLADLHRRCGNVAEATSYRDAALQAAPTPAMRKLLKRRLQDASHPA